MPQNLSPKSTTSAIILTSTGSTSQVTGALPIGAYTASAEFISGAAAQVSYVYKKLGGDVVDIELTPDNVYAAYEEAVLEYSYIINLHQAKNVLSSVLGETTGTFDHKGETLSGPVSASLKYPRFSIGYSRRVGDAAAGEAGFGGTIPQYSASFKATSNTQDYDLQSIIQSASANGVDDAGTTIDFSGKVDNNGCPDEPSDLLAFINSDKSRILFKADSSKLDANDLTIIDIGSTFDPFTRDVWHNCHKGWEETGFNQTAPCKECN